jgi:hypothetical protein
VPEFLVELYAPRADASGGRSLARRARTAAEELTREGVPVRHVRTIFVPEDETCLLLFEGATEESVEAALRRAHLCADRIAEANSPRP